MARKMRIDVQPEIRDTVTEASGYILVGLVVPFILLAMALMLDQSTTYDQIVTNLPWR